MLEKTKSLIAAYIQDPVRRLGGGYPGGVELRVDSETFKAVVFEFVDAYERHWAIKVDDDSTWARRPCV